MAEQSYELMHKDDVVASLQLDDLSGAILKVTPGTNPELLPLGGSQGADSLRKWWLRRAVPISQGNIAAAAWPGTGRWPGPSTAAAAGPKTSPRPGNGRPAALAPAARMRLTAAPPAPAAR